MDPQHDRRTHATPIETVLKFWPIILGFAAIMIGGFGSYVSIIRRLDSWTARITTVEKRVDGIEIDARSNQRSSFDQYEKIQESLTELKVDMREVKTQFKTMEKAKP